MSFTTSTYRNRPSLQPPPHDLVTASLADMQNQLKAHAAANGYKIATRSSEGNSIRYKCHRSGHKPSLNSSSLKTNCPFAFKVLQIVPSSVPDHLRALALDGNESRLPPIGSWTIHIQNPTHNHEPIGFEPEQADSHDEKLALSAINERSSMVSNRILQIPHEQRAQALDEIDQVIAKYFILKPPRSAIQSSATDIIRLPESTTSKEALTSHLDPTQSIIGPSKPHIASLSIESTNGTDDVPRPVKKKRKKTPSINILQVTSHPKADLTITETTELFAPQSLVRSSPPLPPLFSPSQTDPAPLAPLSPPLRFDSHCTSTYTSDLANALINPLHPCLVDYESEPPDDTEQFPSPNLSPTNSPIEISSTDNVPHIIGQTQAASPDSSKIEATVAPISPSCGNNDDGDGSFQVESLLPCLHSIQEQTQKVDNTPLSPLQPPTQIVNQKKKVKPLQPEEVQNDQKLRRSTRHQVAETVSITAVNPDSVSSCVRRSTRTRKTQKDQRVPHWLHEYVELVSDPCGDGHCGYRAIAISLGRTEDDWKLVREELIDELNSKVDFYESHLAARKNGLGGVSEHISALRTGRNTVLDTPSLWLNSARMLYIIASTYKRLFCVYGEGAGCFSALPLEGPVNDNPPIFLCYDHKGLHFLSLSLISSHIVPIPNPWKEWYTLAKPDAIEWANKFDSHFKKFHHCIRPILLKENPWLYGKKETVDLVSDSD